MRILKISEMKIFFVDLISNPKSLSKQIKLKIKFNVKDLKFTLILLSSNKRNISIEQQFDKG